MSGRKNTIFTRVNVLVAARVLSVAILTFALSGCKGTRGILLDLWSWDEIAQRSDSAEVYVEEGAVEIVSYPRKNVWIQRHVYAFEGSLTTADYYVENRIFHVNFDCDGPATCFADHWLEVPERFPMKIAVDTGSISMLGLSGAMELNIGDVAVYAEELEVPSLSVRAEGAPLIAVGFKTAPSLVRLSGMAEEVEILLPPGRYNCGTLPASVHIDPAIVCDAASTSVLEVSVTTPALKVGPIVP